MFQRFESSFERKKPSLKRQFPFSVIRIGRMQFLLDLGFWHLMKEAWTKLFSNAKSIHLYKRKRSWKSHNLTEKNWTIIFSPICLILALILFHFFFASFFLVRPSWSSDKTRKNSIFFELSRIIAYKISIGLVLFDARLSCFSFQDIVLGFCCQELQAFSGISFHDLEKSCKVLRTLPEMIAKILARIVKKPRNFLARKPRHQTLGCLTHALHIILEYILLFIWMIRKYATFL